MAYDFKPFEQKLKDATLWLEREFSAVRTGRATPALLDMIEVEVYGSRMRLEQVGSVGVEDARTLRISLWDKNQIKDVERAIAEANLGLSVVSDDKGLRVIFPELTSDRRTQLLKLAKAKLEEARVAVRKGRDEAMKDLDARAKGGDMGDDERFKAKEEVQKRVDGANSTLDKALSQKESEISQ